MWPLTLVLIVFPTHCAPQPHIPPPYCPSPVPPPLIVHPQLLINTHPPSRLSGSWRSSSAQHAGWGWSWGGDKRSEPSSAAVHCHTFGVPSLPTPPTLIRTAPLDPPTQPKKERERGGSGTRMNARMDCSSASSHPRSLLILGS